MSNDDAVAIAKLNDFDRQVLNTMALLPHEFFFYDGGFIHAKLGQFKLGWLGAQQIMGGDLSTVPNSPRARSTRSQPMATRRRLTFRGGLMVKQAVKEVMGSAIGEAELRSIVPSPDVSAQGIAGGARAAQWAKNLMQGHMNSLRIRPIPPTQPPPAESPSVTAMKELLKEAEKAGCSGTERAQIKAELKRVIELEQQAKAQQAMCNANDAADAMSYMGVAYNQGMGGLLGNPFGNVKIKKE
jgi:hypothetical protein